MNKDENLQREQAKGEMYQRAYDSTVQPFITAKQEELFSAFLTHPSTDTDGLVLIKLQLNTLQSMADEFQSYISTGKLAEQQLKDTHDEC